MVKVDVFSEGCSVVGTAKELSKYMKDMLHDEMFEIPSGFGWGFMEDGDFLEHLRIASELDRIWLSGDTDVYTMTLKENSLYDLKKGGDEKPIEKVFIQAEDFRDKAWGIARIDGHTELVLEMTDGYSELYYRDAETKMPTTESIFFEEPDRKRINDYCRKMHGIEFATRH